MQESEFKFMVNSFNTQNGRSKHLNLDVETPCYFGR